MHALCSMFQTSCDKSMLCCLSMSLSCHMSCVCVCVCVHGYVACTQRCVIRGMPSAFQAHQTLQDPSQSRPTYMFGHVKAFMYVTGFKLDTLLKLADVKGTDRKTSLLHFVLDQLLKDSPAMLTLPHQLASIKPAANLQVCHHH